MHRIVAFLPAGLLTACADACPDPAVSPKLDGGITSSGGGACTLGRSNADVAIRTGPTP